MKYNGLKTFNHIPRWTYILILHFIFYYVQEEVWKKIYIHVHIYVKIKIYIKLFMTFNS